MNQPENKNCVNNNVEVKKNDKSNDFFLLTLGETIAAFPAEDTARIININTLLLPYERQVKQVKPKSKWNDSPYPDLLGRRNKIQLYKSMPQRFNPKLVFYPLLK